MNLSRMGEALVDHGNLTGEPGDCQAVLRHVGGQPPVLVRGLQMVAPETDPDAEGCRTVYQSAVKVIVRVQQEKGAVILGVAAVFQVGAEMLKPTLPRNTTASACMAAKRLVDNSRSL